MKILVAYYSLHGHTEQTAKMIAKFLRADLENIIDKKDRSHLTNWRLGAFDEDLRKATQIEESIKNAADYDLVVIGTPIWDGVVPAVKAYLAKNKFKNVAFFLTFNAAAEDGALVMSQLAQKAPVAVLEIQDLQVKKLEGKELIKKFCKEIKNKI
ncbi:hypothetical protein GW933_03440 [Candidatus Falkowbacteria bacterium]|uniref:Flavodoxin-like domain-containing protein n=1 Tax=Candidatus Buchananbacteria bacterium CG10_big_fil_rev_8_21_14_0_10_33_19 TaxID=1974525 RepID=A0A2H0W4S1_9BACT|nr:hypothetical protein [Candidatus Falkowbacteria bacterium]PIS06353.1 MAG: hypothetical protein COT80_02185 [Candidatus Buchananbacteria bacterium CG10_big_fil_rev_8_21_14_0_10_33_19]